MGRVRNQPPIDNKERSHNKSHTVTGSTHFCARRAAPEQREHFLFQIRDEGNTGSESPGGGRLHFVSPAFFRHWRRAPLPGWQPPPYARRLELAYYHAAAPKPTSAAAILCNASTSGSLPTSMPRLTDNRYTNTMNTCNSEIAACVPSV